MSDPVILQKWRWDFPTGGWVLESGANPLTATTGKGLVILCNWYHSSPLIPPPYPTDSAGTFVDFQGAVASGTYPMAMRIGYQLNPTAGNHTITPSSSLGVGSDDGLIYILQDDTLPLTATNPLFATSGGAMQDALTSQHWFTRTGLGNGTPRIGDRTYAFTLIENSVAVTTENMTNPEGWKQVAAHQDGTGNLPSQICFKDTDSEGQLIPWWHCTADSNITNHLAVTASFRRLAPYVTGQPTAQTAAIGGTATFTVTATASAGSNSYQWQDDSSGVFADIGGATSANYVTPTATYEMRGRGYRARVSDSNGIWITDVARLDVAQSIIDWTPADAYLRSVPSDADPDDGRLYDPTQPDAGGGIFNLDAADAITASDSASALDTDGVAAADSVTLTDLASEAYAIAVAAADAASASDAATETPTLSQAATDSITATDAAAGAMTVAAAGADTVAAADASSSAMTVPATAADAVSATDGATEVTALPATATDAVAASDSSTQTPVLAAAASDAAAAADSATETPTMTAQAADPIAAADAGAAAMVAPASASDAAAAADTASSVIAQAVAATDAASASDSANRTPVIDRSATDAISASDAAAITTVLNRLAADAVNLADAAAAIAAIFSLSATDLVALVDSATAIEGVPILWSEDRTWHIRAENRTLVIASEDRTYRIIP